MARAIGINHVALEVGDLDAALEWWSGLVQYELRGRVPRMAFLDLGDQFLALQTGRRQGPDESRHFGLVVDDREAVRASLLARGEAVAERGGLQVRDPWGNQVEIVDYRDVQFLKAPGALRALGAGDLGKSDAALAELRAKGIAAVEGGEGESPSAGRRPRRSTPPAAVAPQVRA